MARTRRKGKKKSNEGRKAKSEASHPHPHLCRAGSHEPGPDYGILISITQQKERPGLVGLVRTGFKCVELVSKKRGDSEERRDSNVTLYYIAIFRDLIEKSRIDEWAGVCIYSLYLI